MGERGRGGGGGVVRGDLDLENKVVGGRPALAGREPPRCGFEDAVSSRATARARQGLCYRDMGHFFRDARKGCFGWSENAEIFQDAVLELGGQGVRAKRGREGGTSSLNIFASKKKRGI